MQLDFTEHCHIEFGAYAQVHEENQPTNSMELKTTGAIALGSKYNFQSGYKFYSLTTGKVIDHRSFTELPITSDVIARIEELAKAQQRPAELVFKGQK